MERNTEIHQSTLRLVMRIVAHILGSLRLHRSLARPYDRSTSSWPGNGADFVDGGNNGAGRAGEF